MVLAEAFNIDIPGETREKLLIKSDQDLRKIQQKSPDVQSLSFILYNNYITGIYIGLNNCNYFDISESDMDRVIATIPTDINATITQQIVALSRCLFTESDVTAWQVGLYGSYLNGIVLGYNLKKMKDLLKSIIKTT